MEALANILQKHTVVVLNEALKHGFTQLPNFVLKDRKLSFGARLAYAVLLSYAWNEDSCFPGQARMARDLGTADRSVRRFLDELRRSGYISWKRQGLNKPNIYYILNFKPIPEADRTLVSGQDRTRSSVHDRTPMTDY